MTFNHARTAPRCTQSRLLWARQQTQHIYLTSVQRRPNVFDAGPTFHKCYTNVLCSLGDSVWAPYVDEKRLAKNSDPLPPFPPPPPPPTTTKWSAHPPTAIPTLVQKMW